MKVKVAREDTYIPKWRDNRKLPGAEQIKVHFKYMTAEQEEKLSQFVPRYENDKNEMELDVKINEVAVWNECVTKIEGLFDKQGKPLTSPKDVLLIPHGYSLITEVTAYIRYNVKDDDLKN